MPIATPQGTLDFKSVDKVTFVGASSNTVIDTTTGSLGVGVDVNGPTSNLHVVGNAYVSSNLTVSGNVEVGTANLFVDTVNSKVGIGKTAPLIDFDVGGNGENTRIGRSTTGSVHSADKRNQVRIGRFDQYEGIGDQGFLGMRLMVDTAANLGLSGQADNQSAIQFYTWGNNVADSREVMRINSLGNVGILKTSPATALDVNGIIKQTGANWALTNASVDPALQYRGAYPGDYAYLNRTLSTPTNVTLTHENQGGYNTRSRITIGTSGKYAMYINGFRQTGTSGTKELFIYKNGTYQSVRAYSGPEGTSNYATAGSAYTIMDLNANDYVEVHIAQGRYHGNDSIYFAGHLIA